MKMSNEITVTLKDIVESLSSLNKLNDDVKFDFKTSYDLSKIIKKLEPVVETYRETLLSYYKDNGELKDDKYHLNAEETKKLEDINKDILKEEHILEINKIGMKRLIKYEVPVNVVKNILWMIDESN
jgi:hypothetical protein